MPSIRRKYDTRLAALSEEAAPQPATPPAAAVVSPYLTAAEAAAYLRSTVQGVYSLVKRGRIKSMPGSGKLLFTRHALDKYLNSKRL